MIGNNEDLLPPPGPEHRRPGALLLHRRDAAEMFLRGSAEGYAGGRPLRGAGVGRQRARVG